MLGDRAQRLAHYEDVHVIQTERDHALAQAEAAEQRAEDLALENATLNRANESLKRENEEFRAVHVRLTEQLVEARSQIPEGVKVEGARL